MRESIWGALTFFVVVAVLFALAPAETVSVTNNSTNATQTVDNIGGPVVNTLAGVGLMAAAAVFIGAFVGDTF